MSNLPEQHYDIGDHMKASAGDDHAHPVNLNVHPGTSERSDFDPGGPEVPARNARERVDPGAINDQRRAPFIDVTPVVSGHGNSHNAEPPPSRL